MPNAALRGFRDALTQSLLRACSDPSVSNVLDLLILPKLLLAPGTRGGVRHRRALPAIIADRVTRWKAGERSTLYAAITGKPQANRRKNKPVSSHTAQQVVLTAVKEGALSKAAKLLIEPKGIAPLTLETQESLRQLHPSAAPPQLNPLSESESLSFELAEVHRAISTFPRGSTGGPSGLRPHHLKQCLKGAGHTLVL